MGDPFPTSNFSGHLARVITDIPVTFIWNGVSYQGVESSPDMSLNLEIGGNDSVIEFNVFARAVDLPSLQPQVNDIFIIHGKSMRVAHRKVTPDAVLISFAMAYARKSFP